MAPPGSTLERRLAWSASWTNTSKAMAPSVLETDDSSRNSWPGVPSVSDERDAANWSHLVEPDDRRYNQVDLHRGSREFWREADHDRFHPGRPTQNSATQVFLDGHSSRFVQTGDILSPER